MSASLFDTYRDIAAYAREERGRRKITQHEMAKICGVGKSSIHKFENDPSYENVSILEGYFNCFGMEIKYLAAVKPSVNESHGKKQAGRKGKV